MKKLIRNIAYLSLNNQHISILNIAFKMLVNSKKKFIGMLIASTFSAFILIQQPSIYQGITKRITAPIAAIPEVDLWVVGPHTEAFNDPFVFTPSDFYRVRSVPGVQWATQLYRFWSQLTHAKTKITRNWETIGVDPNLLIGLPKTLLEGERLSIRNSRAVVIDGYSLKQLATAHNQTVSLHDHLQDEQNTWEITAITKPLRTYVVEPKLYIASNHIPGILYRPSFILVKVDPAFSIQHVAQQITKVTGFEALTSAELIDRTKYFFSKKTPILINFIFIACLGFIIGLIVMWQIFSNFILTHIHQFGMLKMIGIENNFLIKMVLFQASVIGFSGFFIAFLLNILSSIMLNNGIIAFHLTPYIVLLGFLGSTLIILLASSFSILSVLRTDTIELCRDTN